MLIIGGLIMEYTMTIKNYGDYKFSKGATYIEAVKHYLGENYKKILCIKENNKIVTLDHEIQPNVTIEFLDITDTDGLRVYVRTLCFVYIKAVKDIFPSSEVYIEHSLNKGLSTRLSNHINVNDEVIEKIKRRVDEMVAEDILIERLDMTVEEANMMFEKQGFWDKVNLSKYRNQERIHVSRIGDYYDKFYGYLASSAGYLDKYDFRTYNGGIIIYFPVKEEGYALPKIENTDKLAKVFRESEEWSRILGVAEVASLNAHIENNTIDDIIRVAEALHEKKVAQIADMICEDDNKKLILIAGPSSSGKTTFAQRLSIQLKVNGKKPIAISVDDYFVNRENTPLDEDGNYDFEALEAIDLEQFNSDLIRIMAGEKVEVPRFNFKTGQREYHGDFIQITKDQPIIVEGIHGLNERLTSEIPHENKFKIYISALTQLNVDRHNRIPTTDTRIIRRMVRDFKYRGSDATRTFSLWSSVRRGENKNIFPYQEEADAIFNSALIYELSILKKYAEPMLETITKESEYYPEALRLLRFLEYFVSIEEDTHVPDNSILKEFIGGSCFVRE